MLNHPTLDKLHALKLLGMATALGEQLGSAETELDPELLERLRGE